MTKPTELINGRLEKVNPMKVLTYDEAHETISKTHRDAHMNVSGVHTDSMKKIVTGVVDRVDKETKKLVRK